MFTGKVEKENDGLVTKKPIVIHTAIWATSPSLRDWAQTSGCVRVKSKNITVKSKGRQPYNTHTGASDTKGQFKSLLFVLLQVLPFFTYTVSVSIFFLSEVIQNYQMFTWDKI